MLSKFFIYRPIFALVVSILITLIGAIAMFVLPIARYPEISPPTIQVSASYPGADAKTVATTVATPIEEQINGVEGMAYMQSVNSSDGSMNLTVTFNVGVDLDMANVLVQNRVAIAEPQLPEDVMRQGVTISKQSPEVTLFIPVYAADDAPKSMDALFLSNYATRNIRDELSRINGVGSVNIFGAGSFSMRVWLNPDQLQTRNLTTTDIYNAISEQNVQVAAGQIGAPPAPTDTAFTLTVNAKGRLVTPDEFENIIVKVGDDGQLTRLGDIGRVELGAQTYSVTSTFQGKPCAIIAVYQLPDANAINVANGVKAKMTELSRTFPKGLDYAVAYDSTDVINASVHEVIVTLFITLALVVFVVWIFLQDWRATLIPTITIPVSLIGTFAAMAGLGYSINTLTLFGLVLVIGIVVDDTIVVVENTTRILEEEPTLDPKKAAVKSMQQVTGPVVATTLVLLAVFVPTVFLSGIMGELFRQFSVTISVAVIFSSINALSTSPALCGLLLRASSEPKKKFFLFRWFDGMLGKSRSGYTWGMRLAMRAALVGVILFFAMVGFAGYGFSKLPTGFVPQEDEGWCVANVQLPDAASLDRTSAVLKEIQKEASEIPGVKYVMTIGGYSIFDGSTATNNGSVVLVFEDWSKRDFMESQYVILARLNAKLYEIPQAQAIAFAPPSLPGIGVAGGYTMQILDKNGLGLDTLQEVTENFVETANDQPVLQQNFTTFRANVPQLFVDIDREQVKSMDVSLNDVFFTLQAYLGSAYVNDFTYLDRIYQVRMQAESDYRLKPDEIKQLYVRNIAGQMVPLGAVLDVQDVLGPQTVTHFNIYNSAQVSGSTREGYSSGQGMQTLSEMSDALLPGGMGYTWSGMSYQEELATGSASIIFLFSVVLVYLVLAAQYESWALPWSVVGAVPTALLGAVLGLYARGLDNNVYTQIGIVLLIGLAAKNAILIVEFAKQERETGKSLFDSAFNAGELRFRAVLMTSFSFILGVIPLVVATGAGGKSRQVLGTTVFAGMLVGTIITLIAVPMLYLVIQSAAERLSGPRNKSPESSEQPAAEPAT